MVTPYTNRLFNHIVEHHGLDLFVISCSAREKNRQWSDRYDTKYRHAILRGFEFDLPGSRSAHINTGMLSMLSRLSPEIVAVNGVYPTMLIAALWATIHRRPLAFLTDGWGIMMPRSIYHRIARPMILARARAIICASEKGREFFLQQGARPDRIFVANIVPAWKGPTEIPGLDRRPYDLLWCGRVHDERKNWPFFVALVLELKRRIPSISVRIVADSPTRPVEIDQLSAAGVDLEYSPHVSPDEISSIFATARVLALPSRQDAWGLVCN
ncbi:glycosyltransferase, partial [Rhodoplanes sp. SY1]|uniref:glycosyltransferase n=1 Tax=Rhodoplanes sp. SY1 TaxID=3166646 RepID=UPI0038B5C161